MREAVRGEGVGPRRHQAPAFEAALAFLRPEDQLVVWKVDRLGRSLREMLDTAHSLQDNCFNWFNSEDIRRDKGEALSIKQMVDKMKSDHNIDPKRVFVTGLSAGGAM